MYSFIIFENVTQHVMFINFPHIFKGFSNISVSLWIKRLLLNLELKPVLTKYGPFRFS